MYRIGTILLLTLVMIGLAYLFSLGRSQRRQQAHQPRSGRYDGYEGDNNQYIRTSRYDPEPVDWQDRRYNRDPGNGCLRFFAIIGIIVVVTGGLLILLSIMVQAGLL